MAAKNDIDITIGGKTLTLSGVESEAYLREVASYLNEKLKNFSDDAAYWKLPNDMRNVMLQLNLADDYFKEKSRVKELEEEVQELESHRDRALQELDEMHGAVQQSASRISALETDAAGLRDQAQRAAAAENSAAKRFGAEKSRADKLTEELGALRKSKAESDKAVERFRKELAQTRETMQGELTRTRNGLEKQLADAKAEVNALQKSLNTTAEENKKLKAQLDAARQSGESVKKKLASVEKNFADKLAADTEQYRMQTQSARDELEKTREELTLVQEQENARLQAAARMRSTMQELVQQYGRFGQSLEEAAVQLRSLEE
jgi:cell division protein ZapA